MRVSVMQMNPGANKSENIAQARRLIENAVEQDRPNIVSLPEVWDSLGGDRATRTANAEVLPAKGSNEPGGEAYEFLRETARQAKVHVHGGSIIEQGPEKLFNTTVVFNPDGTELARYRKMHLFDIVAPDGTGYRESNSYGAGDEVVTYEADGVKVGCAICYDVRFPDLFWKLREAGRRGHLPAQRLHPGHRQGPLGSADPRPGDRNPVLVRCPGDLGQASGGQGRSALHLWPFDGRQSVGPPRRPGLRRHRLDHRADRPGPDRQGAPRHAGAGTQEARLSDLSPGPPIAGRPRGSWPARSPSSPRRRRSRPRPGPR